MTNSSHDQNIKTSKIFVTTCQIYTGTEKTSLDLYLNPEPINNSWNKWSNRNNELFIYSSAICMRLLINVFSVILQYTFLQQQQQTWALHNVHGHGYVLT